MTTVRLQRLVSPKALFSERTPLEPTLTTEYSGFYVLQEMSRRLEQCFCPIKYLDAAVVAGPSTDVWY